MHYNSTTLTEETGYSFIESYVRFNTQRNPYCKSLQSVIESHLRPCVERGSLGKIIFISAHNDGFIFIEFLIHQEMIQIVT